MRIGQPEHGRSRYAILSCHNLDLITTIYSKTYFVTVQFTYQHEKPVKAIAGSNRQEVEQNAQKLYELSPVAGWMTSIVVHWIQ